MPCWLIWDKTADKPVLVESNAAVIRRMFYLADKGMGCQTIARKLHADGYELLTGDRKLTLSGPFIWRTLRNKLCVGTSTYTQPEVPDVFPAVVSKPVFYAVQQRLEANKHETARRTNTVPSLFTGLAFCSKCGKSLCRFSQSRNGRIYRYLVCSESYHKHGHCGMTSTRYDALQESFLHLLGQTDLIWRAIGQQEADKPDLLITLSGQLTACQKQIDKLAELIADDPEPSPTIYSALKQEEAKRAQLRQQIETERNQRQLEFTPLEDYDEFHKQFAGRMEQPQYREQVRLLLRNFVLRIEVELGKGHYCVWFKGAKQPVAVTMSQAGWSFSRLRLGPLVVQFLKGTTLSGRCLILICHR